MSLIATRLPFPATLQDLGRVGWLRYGVPRGGAFDFTSFASANRRLGNADGSPGLEITLLGAEFKATESCDVALSGAESVVLVNDQETGVCNRRDPLEVSLAAGDVLEIQPASSGLRVYLCVAGGFIGEDVMGSVSGQKVAAGEELMIGSEGHAQSTGFSDTEISEGPIRLMPGPHATDHNLDTLVSSFYTVTNHSNRVGIRLDGPPLTPQADRPSEPACIGAIQISNSGQPILLGPDGPTIGGYPIVAVVRRVDQSRVGQLRPGDEVAFTVS